MLFELGLGPIPWMIVTEMYDTDHVSAAQATASQLNWVCNILVGLGFPLLDAGLGPLAGLAEALAVRALALVLAVDGAASGALAAAAAERCPGLQPVIIAALAKASA